MSNPVRIGLVGLGRAGWGMHLKELADKTDMFVFTAACDLIAERREAMEARFPACRTYERIEDLIADENVDLVSIATRSVDHFAHAKMALQAGKDVLIEKPMSMTYEQAAELKRLSEEDDTCGTLYVRHNRRFEPDFLYVKDLIASGKLGRVFEIRLARNNYQRRDDWQTLSRFGGGQTLNWGPHIVDHALRLLECEPRRIISHLDHVTAGGDCDDHIKILFEGENDRIIDMEISGGCALPVPEYMLYGTRGACTITQGKAHLRYIDPAQELKPVVSDPGTPVQSFGKSNTFKSAEVINWVEEDVSIPQTRLDEIWAYLYASIREGKPFPITLEEAVGVIKVIDDAKKASRFH